MPAGIRCGLGVIGAAVLARWCVKEMQRVNAELDACAPPARVEPIDRTGCRPCGAIPETGEYRPTASAA